MSYAALVRVACDLCCFCEVCVCHPAACCPWPLGRATCIRDASTVQSAVAVIPTAVPVRGFCVASGPAEHGMLCLHLPAGWWTALRWRALQPPGASLWSHPAACCCTCGSGGVASAAAAAAATEPRGWEASCGPPLGMQLCSYARLHRLLPLQQARLLQLSLWPVERLAVGPEALELLAALANATRIWPSGRH